MLREAGIRSGSTGLGVSRAFDSIDSLEVLLLENVESFVGRRAVNNVGFPSGITKAFDGFTGWKNP
jgi:hypothetical protein